MIRVDRSRVKLPGDLVHKLRKEQEKLIAFHKEMGAGSKQSQQRTFDYKILSQTRPFLRELFNNKCAYCESLLVGQSGDLVEKYRPKGTIEERDGAGLAGGVLVARTRVGQPPHRVRHVQPSPQAQQVSDHRSAGAPSR